MHNEIVDQTVKVSNQLVTTFHILDYYPLLQLNTYLGILYCVVYTLSLCDTHCMTQTGLGLLYAFSFNDTFSYLSTCALVNVVFS